MFCGPSAFSNTFRAVTGHTPRAYRGRHLAAFIPGRDGHGDRRVSQTRAVPSAPPVTSLVPSGLYATAYTSPV